MFSGTFRRLIEHGDLLVLNDSRVLPARLIGRRAKTGGKWEGLFLRETPDGLWELFAQTKGKPTGGESFVVEPGGLELTLRSRTEGRWLMEPGTRVPAAELLEIHGRPPLPPYIRHGLADAVDRDRYQTVYAREAGSVAAPTAGLHFTTWELINWSGLTARSAPTRPASTLHRRPPRTFAADS